MKKVLRYLAGIIVILLILMVVDYRVHLSQSVATKLDWYQKMLFPTTHLTVVLDGAQSSGSLLTHDLIEQALEYGDVAVSNYDRHRVDGEKMATDIAYAIRQRNSRTYRTVTFVGLSMGGLLSYDVIQIGNKLNEADPANKQTYTVGFVDSPTGLVDLQDQRAKWVARAPIGRGFAFLFTWLFWKASFHPSKIEDIEPEDVALLKRHWAESGSWPLDGWRDEIAFIVNHPKPKANGLQGVPTVALRSRRDVTVKSSFVDSWTPVVGKEIPVQEVDSNHIGLLEFNKKWKPAIAWMFDKLGIPKRAKR